MELVVELMAELDGPVAETVAFLSHDALMNIYAVHSFVVETTRRMLGRRFVGEDLANA
jgi:hypothetical protein